MGRVTTAQKIGVVARVAAQRARGNRTLRAIGKGVATTLKSWGLALRKLWLEVIGLVFVAMAASGATWLIREFSRHSATRPAKGRVVVAACFVLVFVWFGVSSFWKAWKNAPRN